MSTIHKNYLIISDSAVLPITPEQRVMVENGVSSMPNLANRAITALTFHVQLRRDQPYLIEKTDINILAFNDDGIVVTNRNQNIPNLGAHKNRIKLWERFEENAKRRKIPKSVLALINADIFGKQSTQTTTEKLSNSLP